MARKIKLACCFALCAAAALSWYESGLRAVAAQAQPVEFKRDIEPILAANCYGCHGPQKASAQLRLDVKALALRGGLGGAVITPGNGKDSRLVHRILGAGGEQRMPLGKPALKPEQLALIQRWIDQGAPWPESESAIGSSQEPQSAIPRHWAFVSPVRPVLPTVKNSARVKTPIDRFILARLEKEGLTPSPQAEKTTLARRLYLDLLGLPPSPQEMDEFLADASPDAYEKLVEKLLASPHYGERWGRWWLDAARYADSNGFEKDEPRSIWPYRDWVINAFNRDLPFDQFTVEQLAGGLLSLKIGGPSVFPPIPDGVMSLAFGTTPMKWEASAGKDRYRRALYTFWKRSVPYPSMLAFDAPSADFSCTQRMRSNTPLQALTTLNDAVFVEAAQAMALRVWREGGADDRSRMNYAYQLCTGRRPDAVELQRLLAFLNKQQTRFAGRTAAAVYVSAADLSKLPEDVDLHQIAPWTMVARALLNLDETITKE